MTEENILVQVTTLVADLVTPLQTVESMHDAELLLLQWGWVVDVPDVQPLIDAVEAVVEMLSTLETLSFETVEDVLTALSKTELIVSALGAIPASLASVISAPPISDAVAVALAEDALNGLLRSWIQRTTPVGYEVLELIGVIVRDVPSELVHPPTGDPILWRPPIPASRLSLKAITELISDPVGHIKTHLGLNGVADQAAAEEITRVAFGALARVAEALGMDTWVGLNFTPDQSDPILSTLEYQLARSAGFGVGIDVAGAGRTVLSLVAEVIPSGTKISKVDPISEVELTSGGLRLLPEGSWVLETALGPGTLTVEASAAPPYIILPIKEEPFIGGSSTGSAGGVELTILWARDEAASPVVLGASSTGLIINGAKAGAMARFGRSERPDLDVDIQAAVDQARLVLNPGEADGFLSSVLPADGLAVEFDLGIGWSTTRGLYFAGSASLEADLPVHVDILGVLLIETIHLGLAAKDTGVVTNVSADIEVHLGPVKATVLGMGLRASLAPAPASAQGGGAPAGTKLGSLQALIGIQPPRGVNLVIDAEVVKGAGFILNDYERGRYAGGLSLSIADVVSVDALGLITTKLPDGSEGFSMLVILTATFPPIQLGFGFTLTGLGGLLGVHRTMDLPVLRDKVRTGALDSILFPVNPLGRIVQVLNEVESVFPIARDRFTVGLMARLGWGSPQTIQADIGLILSLPMPISIALLGRVSAILPDPEAAIVELRIDVAGGLDLGRQELWIEAVLRDSRVAIFELSGGFALRSSWGPDPVFLLSVGGFNPHFTPPPDFRAPDRLAISLATSDNPRIRLESYLAITSNSLQIGARLDAFGSIEVLGVWSAQVYASFDALFTFVPFQFIVDLAGGVQICHDGKPFLGASFLLSLQGPEPLRAIGYVEVVFLGTHRIPLDITIGTGREQAAITAADPATLLAAAIKDQRNWSAVPPVLQQAVVTRDPEGAALMVHPAGSLTFRQRVVPLEVQFQLFGGQPVPGGSAQFTLTYSVGGPPPTNPALTSIRDAWAPADLFPLSDAERISQPSFTQLVSGHTGIGSRAAGTSGPEVTENLDEFETSVIDADDWLPRRMSRPTVKPSISAAVLSGAHRASLAQSGDRWGARAESMAVTCLEPQYRVVAADSLAPKGDTLFDSWVEAGASAGGDPRLLVVPAHEARAR